MFSPFLVCCTTKNLAVLQKAKALQNRNMFFSGHKCLLDVLFISLKSMDLRSADRIDVTASHVSPESLWKHRGQNVFKNRPILRNIKEIKFPV
jgi:hypothetical protein